MNENKVKLSEKTQTRNQIKREKQRGSEIWMGPLKSLNRNKIGEKDEDDNVRAMEHTAQ